MLRHLVFDWSGTLCDDLLPVVATSNAILERYGKEPLSRAQFLDEFTLPYTKYYEKKLPGVPVEDLQKLWVDLFPKDGGEVTPIPGARELLEVARETGRRIFLLSSVPREHFDSQALRCGFTEFFEDHFNSAIDKRDSLRELLDKHGLDPAETAYVGDMVHDMETARALGVRAIGVATGYEPAHELLQAGAEMLFEDLSQLAQLFRREEPRPIATVGALLHDGQGKVLLFRTAKWSDTWGIPGGKIERGESSEQALRREIMEETALEIDGIEFVMVQDAVDPPQFQRPAHFLLMNYVARALPGEVILNEEAQEFEWAPLEKAFDWNLNEPTRVLVKEVVRLGLVPITDSASPSSS